MELKRISPMKFTMTRATNRNYIEPMFWFIAFMVMIVLCLLTTRTHQRHRPWHSLGFYSIINNAFGLCLYLVFLSILFLGIFIFICLAIPFCGQTTSPFPLFCFIVFFARLLAFFSLVIFVLLDFSTQLTIRKKPAFRFFIPRKFQNRFSFFAFGTLFCYDLFRHNCFSNKQLCLEPVARHNLAVGSFYFSRKMRIVK